MRIQLVWKIVGSVSTCLCNQPLPIIYSTAETAKLYFFKYFFGSELGNFGFHSFLWNSIELPYILHQVKRVSCTKNSSWKSWNSNDLVLLQKKMYISIILCRSKKLLKASFLHLIIMFQRCDWKHKITCIKFSLRSLLYRSRKQYLWHYRLLDLLQRTLVRLKGFIS